VFCYLGPFGDPAGPWSLEAARAPIALDVALFTLFAAHHSLFARTGLKTLVSHFVSPSLERSVYVWIASLLFIAMCAAWQPVPGIAWSTRAPWLWTGLAIGQLAGLALTALSSKQLGVLELAGLSQATGHVAPPRTEIVRRGCYAIVRHPLYFGWVLMVWSTPQMTGTRLIFAAISTLYLVLAVPFEERSLRRASGSAYDTYARQVRWRIVPFVY
jgi:protein-S-isoprenylcysteine O-methyltransferase Ste14